MSNLEEKYKNICGKYGILGGRPVAFKRPKALREKMLAFLEMCEQRKRPVVGKGGEVVEINDPAPVTIEDFCAFAGITKTTLYDYGRKPEYSDLVEQFKQIVEAYWVRQCAEGKAGNKADFVLKNSFGGAWKESSDVTMTVKQALVGYVDDGKKCSERNDGESV
ncbi:MAG: terminase small subunit [Alphaproteobacteria bacterium]